jgi:hypothetical protein
VLLLNECLLFRYQLNPENFGYALVQYNNFTYPHSTKQGIAECLENSVTAICANEDSLKEEQATVRAIRYPPKYLNTVLSKSQKQNPTNQETTKCTPVVPYDPYSGIRNYPD